MTLKQVCNRCKKTFYCKGASPNHPGDCFYVSVGGCCVCDNHTNLVFKCGTTFDPPKPRLGRLIGGKPIQ